MKNYKAFTFVELLLVMLVLGIIITLTMPILRNIKDDEDIYRSYMKKANQDVTDAANMIFIKEPRFTGFSMLKPGETLLTKDSLGLRYAFNLALNTFTCGQAQRGRQDYTESKNLSTDCTYGKSYIDETNSALNNNIYGLVLAGKPVLMFKYDDSGNLNGEQTYGYIYVDMNKDKAPNEPCKDRYRFIIYNDRVAMDTREHYTCTTDGKKVYAADSGCSFNLSKSCTADVNEMNNAAGGGA